MSKGDEQKAVQAYKKARRALNAYQCESGEDATYLRLNAAVIKAEKKLPWWKRI